MCVCRYTNMHNNWFVDRTFDFKGGIDRVLLDYLSLKLVSWQHIHNT